MASMLVGSTSRGGLSVEQVGGNDVYRMHAQIQTILEQEKCRAGHIFAEPQDAGRSIDWYTDSASSVIPFGKLKGEEQLQLLGQLQEAREAIRKCAGDLRKKGATGRTYSDVLDKALVYPENRTAELIFSVDGRPVMTGWGFSDGSNKTVDGIFALIKEVQKKVASTPPTGLPPEDTGQMTPPLQQPELAASSNVPPVAFAPGNIPGRPETGGMPPGSDAPATESGQRKSSLLWLWLLICLLVLLGAAAVWFFFFRGPANFSGTLNSSAVLVNAQNEPVDITLDFSKGDGTGIVTVVEPGQTCRGTATSRLEDEYVLINITGIPCPNGDNFEAIAFRCEQDTRNCEATAADGSAWRVQMN